MVAIGNVDWNAIRAEYIGGGISQRKLAQKYGIAEGTLLQRANTEGWRELRNQATIKSITKTQQKTAETAADNAAIAAEIKRKALMLVNRLLDQYIEQGATEHRTTRDGVTDVMRLKDITAAYKDIADDLPKIEADKNAPVYDLLKRLDDECGI